MKRFIVPMFAMIAMAGFAFAAEKTAEVKSGLPLGTPTTAFNVKDITGPSAGKSLCYRCQYGAKPVACIFTREITEEVATLIKEIDTKVGENGDKKMCAFVVLLTDNADEGAKKLLAVAKDKGIKNVPLTVFDGVAGPEKYQISKDAAVTVMMWNKSRIAVNQAYAAAKLPEGEVKKLAGETAKILN
ncbi:hypothetical protein [Humisphaera borealis]|nr:hypothetical protein [Humisphaera borealis]